MIVAVKNENVYTIWKNGVQKEYKNLFSCMRQLKRLRKQGYEVSLQIRYPGPSITWVENRARMLGLEW